MNPEIELNERVEVVAIFRTGVNTSQICMPAKMRYKGREIIFTELGLRHPTSKGQRMIHVFDMSDGSADYRLEFDAEQLTWTLIKMLEAR